MGPRHRRAALPRIEAGGEGGQLLPGPRHLAVPSIFPKVLADPIVLPTLGPPLQPFLFQGQLALLARVSSYFPVLFANS